MDCEEGRENELEGVPDPDWENSDPDNPNDIPRNTTRDDHIQQRSHALVALAARPVEMVSTDETDETVPTLADKMVPTVATPAMVATVPNSAA